MGDGNRDTLCRYMPPYLCSISERHCFGDMTTDELFTTVCLMVSSDCPSFLSHQT
ncbi:BnaC08g20090D [Brassica napus]|uniref:(rape) hypothetical protein n=1 Tax=Brassica napus TaxID=3708 RepID=A0A078HJZ2_BRANA|nr:unnamed protein product [Brassica napus]CDY38835.1 BnaC08g20090D [Brassica napus]